SADATPRLHTRQGLHPAGGAHVAIGPLRVFRNAADAGDPPAVWRRRSHHGGHPPGTVIEPGRVGGAAHTRALEAVARAIRLALGNPRAAAVRAEIRLCVERAP